ncbi:hypothetical protein D3C72_1085430 [compost metagenome]
MLFDDLDLEALGILGERARQAHAYTPAASHHHPAHGLLQLAHLAVERRQHITQVFLVGQHEHLVARLDARAAFHRDEAVSLVVKAAVDTHHAHGALRQVLLHIGHAQAHQRRTAARAHRSQRRVTLRKLPHLQGLGVTHQLADVTHQGLFGAEGMGHAETTFFQ